MPRRPRNTDLEATPVENRALFNVIQGMPLIDFSIEEANAFNAS
jgi:hypothetical protein